MFSKNFREEPLNFEVEMILGEDHRGLRPDLYGLGMVAIITRVNLVFYASLEFFACRPPIISCWHVSESTLLVAKPLRSLTKLNGSKAIMPGVDIIAWCSLQIIHSAI